MTPGSRRLFKLVLLPLILGSLLGVGLSVLLFANPTRLEPLHDPYSTEGLHRHLERLAPVIADRGYHVELQPPFVVIGDLPPTQVRGWTRGTVRWGQQQLKALYFDKDPKVLIDVWLFPDEASYTEASRTLFGIEPSTPFGYYTEAHSALVMNISTGGGTLMHEIVHPYVHANYPACPPWLNEGLASLYEQSRSVEVDGKLRLVGLPNWRLAGLQQAILANHLPSLAELCAMDARTLNNYADGNAYAQARYLCYYLQEQGLLQEFYHRLKKNQPEDSTGYRTLLEMLRIEESEVPTFESRWRRFVMELDFP